jgi:voltage-dependent calcium channel L type alpha-1D
MALTSLIFHILLQVPRFNFDSFLWSAITVFKIITTDNWNENMYGVIRSNRMYDALYPISLVRPGPFSCAYKCASVHQHVVLMNQIVFGNFIMMNLFLALLLDKFSSDGEEKPESEETTTKPLAQHVNSMKIVPLSGDILAKKHAHPDEQDKRQQPARVLYQRHHHVHLDQLTEHPEDFRLGPSVLAALAATSKTESPELVASSEATRVLTLLATPRPFESKVHDESTVIKEGPTARFIHELRGNSLFVFPGKSRVRRWALNLIAHPYFDAVVLALVAASSITLAIDNPLQDPESALASALKHIDTAFAVVFACEMAIKIVALGLVLHQGAYLRDGWNVLDCVVVISSLVMLAESLTSRHSLKSLRSLRTFRAFRPLRMVSRRPGLKLVVNALIEAIPAVLNVLILCALFYLMFSIFAVTYLKGQLNSCSGAAFDALSKDQVDFLVSPQPWSALSLQQQQWFTNTSCIEFPIDSLTSKYLCGCWGGDWQPVVPRNFDNVGNAMITFFELSTTENWGLLMLACIDATEIDMQPIRDHNMWWAAFFGVFMMFGSFFMVNLFIGVIIDNFNKMTDAQGEAFLLTDEQKKWIKAQKAAAQVGPQLILKPFKDPVRRAMFFFVRHPRFEWFIMACIIVNTLLMAAQHFGQSTTQTTIVSVFNDVFATIFTIEAALKIAAYGRAYFQDNWNRFDFFVVTGTLISIVLEALTTARLQSLAMLVRVFRVTRIIRLVKASKGIQHILTTLYLALPGLANVSSILFLLLFIYTTLGVQMFAKVGLSDNIDTHANFQSFGTGFLFMVRAATGESWNDCMHDFVASPEGCVDDPEYDPTMCGFNNSADCIPLNGCGNPVAYLFFCSFTLLGTYVMLNVTVAVILDSFSVSNEDEEPLFEPELVSEFQTKWAQVDPKARGFISVAKLRAVFSILEPPLVKDGTMLDKSAFLRYVCKFARMLLRWY